MIDILEKTAMAFENNQIEELLLGLPPYGNIPKFSPVPKGVLTDMTVLYTDGLVVYQSKNPGIASAVNFALKKRYQTNLGVYTQAIFLMTHAYNRLKNREILNLNEHELAQCLREYISENKEKLMLEKVNFNGNSFESGFWGVLEKMSEQTVKFGGASFFPYDMKN